MTMDQQVALERQRELYREKNAHLGKYLEPVESFEFYREIFPRGRLSAEVTLRTPREMVSRWWCHQKTALRWRSRETAKPTVM